MTRITTKHLETTINELNELTGNPVDPYTNKNGKCVANVGAYLLDSAYGGYKLAQIANENGAERDVFNCGYVRPGELFALINAYLAGIKYGNTKG